MIALAMAVALIDGLPSTSSSNLKSHSAAVRNLAKSVERARAWLLAPFAPIQRTFALRQSWKLFSAVHDTQHRMWIEARDAASGPWRLLYRPHDSEHPFMASALHYRRVRGAWNPGLRGPAGGYQSFVDWIARRVFAAEPRAREVRVRMERILILPRGAGYLSSGAFDHEMVRARPEVSAR